MDGIERDATVVKELYDLIETYKVPTPPEDLAVYQVWALQNTLPTYPSPKPTFCPNWEVSDNVDLGEGWVVSFPETEIDPRFFPKTNQVKFAAVWVKKG